MKTSKVLSPRERALYFAGMARARFVHAVGMYMHSDIPFERVEYYGERMKEWKNRALRECADCARCTAVGFCTSRERFVDPRGDAACFCKNFTPKEKTEP